MLCHTFAMHFWLFKQSLSAKKMLHTKIVNGKIETVFNLVISSNSVQSHAVGFNIFYFLK